jgi:hypothetical protein
MGWLGPIWYLVVQNAITAYMQDCSNNGLRECSAVPLGIEKVRQIVMAVSGKLNDGRQGRGNENERLL